MPLSTVEENKSGVQRRENDLVDAGCSFSSVKKGVLRSLAEQSSLAHSNPPPYQLLLDPVGVGVGLHFFVKLTPSPENWRSLRLNTLSLKHFPKEGTKQTR